MKYVMKGKHVFLSRIIITIDPSVIVARATMRDSEGITLDKPDQSNSTGGGGAFSSVFATAKRTFA